MGEELMSALLGFQMELLRVVARKYPNIRRSHVYSSAPYLLLPGATEKILLGMAKGHALFHPI
jgi:hypothetical protein